MIQKQMFKAPNGSNRPLLAPKKARMSKSNVKAMLTVGEEIGQLPQEVFQNVMAKLERRWTHCVDANGMYFEGDKFWIEWIKVFKI